MFSSLRKFHPLRVAASAGLKGALPKVLVGAALLGGGGFVLSAGSAQAQVVERDFSVWVTTPITVGDKTFTYGSSLGLPAGPPTAPTTVEAELLPNGDYLFNVDFASFVTTPFTLNYTASITPAGLAAGQFFTAVDLDSDVDAFPESQEDLTATFAGFTPAVVLSSINGNSAASSGAGAPTVLNVTNVFTPNGGAIDSFENSFRQSSVPGPLPLLGAGMAFGFSRKLRSRIKARVQA